MEENQKETKETVVGESSLDKLRYKDILKLLMDSESWALINFYGHEELVHVDGWRYYTRCGCICIRNDNYENFKQPIGFFMWPIVTLFSNINVWRVRNRKRNWL